MRAELNELRAAGPFLDEGPCDPNKPLLPHHFCTETIILDLSEMGRQKDSSY